MAEKVSVEPTIGGKFIDCPAAVQPDMSIFGIKVIEAVAAAPHRTAARIAIISPAILTYDQESGETLKHRTKNTILNHN